MSMESLHSNLYRASSSIRDSRGPHSSIGSSCRDEVENDADELERLAAVPHSLEKALALNQIIQKRLARNIEQLEETLKSNLRRQIQLHEQEEEEKLAIEEEKALKDSDSKYFLRISSFCKPYFKTKSGMPAPMNEDARFKYENSYVDMYRTQYRQWSSKEQKKLCDAALEEGRNVLIQNLRRKERDITRERKMLDNQDIKQLDKILKLNAESKICIEEITQLQLTPLKSLKVPSETPIDWVKISAQVFDGHRTAEECEYMWRVLLNPNISHKEFSEKDDITILGAVKGYGDKKCDWEAIGQSLSEPRSAFQVFRRYMSFIAPTLMPMKWTVQSSQQLVETIEAHRIGDYIPWTEVHQMMPGFSRAQVQRKWTRVNPHRHKGPFKIEEDYLFLKGLHKFGVNFLQILKFMPRRDIDQLKDRFKRTLFNVFSSHWSEEMDNELRKIISYPVTERLGASFWKRLSMAGGFAKAGMDAMVLRNRFLILKLWKEIYLNDDKPPQLFPVSITTCREEIKQMLTAFKNADIVDVKELVDKINAGNHFKNTLSDLAKKRKRLHLEHDVRTKYGMAKPEESEKPSQLNSLHLHHILSHNSDGQDAKLPVPQGSVHSAVGVRKGYSHRRELTWPEKVLTDFFNPGRDCKLKAVDFQTDEAAIVSITRLMAGLQVKPLPVQPSEVDFLRRLNIHEDEMVLINSLVEQHTCGHKRDVYAIPCLWCSGDAVPETIPVLPPSGATVSALQSLLIHRDTLQTMARKNFIFHRVTGGRLRKLGDKEKPVRAVLFSECQNETMGVPRSSQIGKVHVTTRHRLPQYSRINSSLKRLNNPTKKRGSALPRRPKWFKSSIVDIYKSFKHGKHIAKYEGPSSSSPTKTPTKAPAQQQTDTEPVVTEQSSRVSEPTVVKKGTPGRPRGSTKKVQKPQKKAEVVQDCNITEKMQLRVKQEEVEEQHEETDQNFTVSEMKIEDGPSDVEDTPDDCLLTSEELASRAETDNLLWHRFLAIFLWPSILTLASPTAEQEDVIEQQYNTKKLDAEYGMEVKPSQGQGSFPGVAEQVLQEVLDGPHPQRSVAKRPRGVKAASVTAKRRGRVVPPPSRASTRKRKPVNK